MEPAESSYRCPRCLRGTLDEQTWGGVPLRICLACGANFFAAGTLAQFEGWEFDVPAQALRRADRTGPTVHCPACGAPMDRLEFAMEPPLEIDRCTRCRGILLDYEEIRRVPELGRWAKARGA